MSALDNFVFAFSAEGEQNVNAVIEKLKNAMQDLRETLKQVTEANNDLKKSAKENLNSEKNQTSETLKLYKLQKEQERKDRESDARINRDNEKADILNFNRKIEGARKYRKLQKDIEKDAEIKHKQDLKNLAEINDMKSETNEKEKVADRKKENEKEKSFKTDVSRLKTLGKLFGLYQIASMASNLFTDAFSRNFGMTMAGGFSSLDPKMLKALGSAVGLKGGTYEQATKTITNFQSLLSLLDTSVEANEKLYTSLALAGLMDERKGGITQEEIQSRDAFTLYNAISRAFKGLKTDEEKRRARTYLSGLGFDPATILLLEQEDFAKKMQDFGELTIDTPATVKLKNSWTEGWSKVERAAEILMEGLAQEFIDTMEYVGELPFKIKDIYQSLSKSIDDMQNMVNYYVKESFDWLAESWTKSISYLKTLSEEVKNWVLNIEVFSGKKVKDILSGFGFDVGNEENIGRIGLQNYVPLEFDNSMLEIGRFGEIADMYGTNSQSINTNVGDIINNVNVNSAEEANKIINNNTKGAIMDALQNNTATNYNQNSGMTIGNVFSSAGW